MKFEEKVNLLIIEIYDKIIKYIDNNKNDDDVFYDYAYLNLNNDKQIIYSFNDSIIYITKNDKEGYNDIYYYEVKISNSETIYRLDKKSIIEYYEELNKSIDSVTYNKLKTHDVSNFNIDMYVLYIKYIYEKEISKIDDNNKILPAALIAANWWAEIISRNTRGGNIGNDIDSKMLMTFSDILYPKENISDEQITKFKNVLARKIMDDLCESKGETVRMTCDYGPDILLYEAMKETGINTNRTPFKTDMYINVDYVSVCEGYGSQEVILFDNREEKDIQTVKDIYLETNKKPRTLKRK